MFGTDQQQLQERFPQCLEDDSQKVVMHADFAGEIDGIGGSLRVGFSMAMWLSIFLHAVGVEIYLKLTPRESQRLRQVAYEKQLEAGMKNPGSAGLVTERFGDADPWSPKNAKLDDSGNKTSTA